MQKRPQLRSKFLDLPDEKALASYKKMKLRCFVRKDSKKELIKIIQRSARMQAARDRRARSARRTKTKPWVEVQHRPRGSKYHSSSQSTVPEIVVTTPDGQTRWLDDPNNYECVHLKTHASLRVHRLI